MNSELIELENQIALLTWLPLLAVPLLIVIGVYAITWSWNTSLAQLFQWQKITKKQAFALLVLASFLGVGFRGGSTQGNVNSVTSAIDRLKREVSELNSIISIGLESGKRKGGAFATNCSGDKVEVQP